MAETKRYQYVETKTWFVDIPADHTGNEPGQDELLIQYVIDEQNDRIHEQDWRCLASAPMSMFRSKQARGSPSDRAKTSQKSRPQNRLTLLMPRWLSPPRAGSNTCQTWSPAAQTWTSPRIVPCRGSSGLLCATTTTGKFTRSSRVNYAPTQG
jgi:hypothetical protein